MTRVAVNPGRTTKNSATPWTKTHFTPSHQATKPPTNQRYRAEGEQADDSSQWSSHTPSLTGTTHAQTKTRAQEQHRQQSQAQHRRHPLGAINILPSHIQGRPQPQPQSQSQSHPQSQSPQRQATPRLGRASKNNTIKSKQDQKQTREHCTSGHPRKKIGSSPTAQQSHRTMMLSSSQPSSSSSHRHNRHHQRDKLGLEWTESAIPEEEEEEEEEEESEAFASPEGGGLGSSSSHRRRGSSRSRRGSSSSGRNRSGSKPRRRHLKEQHSALEDDADGRNRSSRTRDAPDDRNGDQDSSPPSRHRRPAAGSGSSLSSSSHSRPRLQRGPSSRRMKPSRSRSETSASVHHQPHAVGSLQRSRSFRRRNLMTGSQAPAHGSSTRGLGGGSSHRHNDHVRRTPSRTNSAPLDALSAQREAQMEAMRASYAMSGEEIASRDRAKRRSSIEYGVGGSTIPQNLCGRGANGDSAVSADEHSALTASTGASNSASTRRRRRILDDMAPLSLTGEVSERGRTSMRKHSGNRSGLGSGESRASSGSRSHSRRRRGQQSGMRSRSRSIESEMSIDTQFTEDTAGTIQSLADATNPADEQEWLAHRLSRQDEILTLANEEKLERERLEQAEYDAHRALTENGDDMVDGNEDGLMMMWKKKTALSQVAQALVRTAGATRSAAKGSVNVVKDPKRAAKHIGSFTKDVAKGTVKVVKDPTKAVKQVGRTTVNVTKGTVNVASGVTKGVAKGTFGVSKTVVKGGLKGTTKVVGGAAHGAKKVAKGTAKLVTNRGSKKDSKGGNQSYDARKLTDRSTATSTLFDRISGLAETSESSASGGLNSEGNLTEEEQLQLQQRQQEEHDETVAAAAAAAATAAAVASGNTKAKRNAKNMSRAPYMIPVMDMKPSGGAQSWDL